MYASNTEGEEAPLTHHQHGIPIRAPDRRTPYQKRLALFFILASTMFERIAYFSLENNVNLFFPSNSTTLSWDPRVGPTGLLLIFVGTTYISTLIFAVISDAKLGRAKTIFTGFVLYLTGCALITAAASGKASSIYPPKNATDSVMDDSQCYAWIMGAFILTAVGAGAVKSNLIVFGADQIQVSKITSRYFDKYIVAANIGGMIAIIITPIIHNKLNAPSYIPHLIAVCMLGAGAVLFLVGYRYYIDVNLNETVIANCIPVVINAFQSRGQYNRNNRSAYDENTDPTSSTLLNASQSLTDEERSVRIEQRPSTFLDFANAANGGKFNDRIVNDVKSLRGAFIVFTLLIPYWIVYNQKDTTFRYQGAYMNETTPEIVSWMSLGDSVVVIIGILLFNVFIYKCLAARNWSLTIMRKFIIGMFFACVAVFIAGGIENRRVDQCKRGPSDLSIYAQLPQNIFIGLSQLFAMVASYEYAYFAAPLSAQSLFMSLHFCSAGVASFIGTAYMAGTARFSFNFDFSCTTVKNTEYEWFFRAHFFMVGGLQLIFIFIFTLCQKKLRIVRLNPQQTVTNQSFQHESI